MGNAKSKQLDVWTGTMDQMREDIVQRTLALADEELSLYAWILLNYINGYEPSNEIWKDLTVEDDDIFLQKLKDIVDDREEHIKEITYSSIIGAKLENAHAVIGNVDHLPYGVLRKHNLHLVIILFDKAYSRLTLGHLGQRLEMFVPDTFLISDAKILLRKFRDLASCSPLNSIPDTYFGPINTTTLWKHSFSEMQEQLRSYTAPVLGAVVGFAVLGACGLKEGITFAIFFGLFGAILGIGPGVAVSQYSTEEALKEAYRYFGIDEDSTAQEIVQSWQQVAARVHPAFGGNINDFFRASVRIWLIAKQRSLPPSKFFY